jgi:hypothetical protein
MEDADDDDDGCGRPRDDSDDGATAMTRLNICDASTEEKERPSNPSRMHATIKWTREQEQRG